MSAHWRSRIYNWLGHLVVHGVLVFVSLACFMPLMLIISASFTNEKVLVREGYRFVPSRLSTAGYDYVLTQAPSVVRAYGVTFFVTGVGSICALLVMSLLAYALSRKTLRLRKPLSFYVLFTLLFNGGLVPTYILITRYLHMRNTLEVLILPIMVVPTYVLILRTYFVTLPEELLDAARIDGAGEWRIFFRIALPLSTPALATIGLFCVLMYWNDWYLALLYIDDQRLYPLALGLFSFMAGRENQFTLIMAGSMIMTLPVIITFFLAQRYFIQGVAMSGMKN